MLSQQVFPKSLLFSVVNSFLFMCYGPDILHPGMLEKFFDRGSFRGVLLKTLFDEVDGVGRCDRELALLVIGLLFHHSFVELDRVSIRRIVVFKWSDSDQKFVSKAAEGEHVSLVVVGLRLLFLCEIIQVAHDFGCHVHFGASKPYETFVAGHHVASKSEVAKFDFNFFATPFLILQHQVVSLQVSVDDVFLVEEVERLHDLFKNLDHFLL